MLASETAPEAALPIPLAARRPLPGKFLVAGLTPALIALLTFAVFSPALWNDFVEWDDYKNFVENFDYRGLAWKNIRWMFTSAVLAQWIPVSWLTLAVDYRIWGMNPFGYHLTNILIHSANAVLFYLLATSLLRSGTTTTAERPLRIGAASAALFFAIHPFRAESVAWVTERRDVLSGFFFLLTVIAYLRAADGGSHRRRWLTISVGCYALAILSKAMVVTLPAVLLLLDVYPLRRLPWQPGRWRREDARRVWLEKIPYAGLAAFGIAMAVWAMRTAYALTPLDRLPITARIPIVFYGIWFYFWKTAVPVGFSPLHELPAHPSMFDLRFALAAVAVLAISGVVVLVRRRWPAGLAVWTAYVVMLSPVSGALHNGHQLVHDRYSYLPGLGFALIFGGIVAALAAGRLHAAVRPSVRWATTAAGAVALLALAGLTAFQTRIWQDTDTLWRYAIEFEPTCSICYNNLAISLLHRQMPLPAVSLAQHAIMLRPDRHRTHGTLGLALLNLGDAQRAIPEFERVLAHDPGDVTSRNNLAAALVVLGRHRDALPILSAALDLNPRAVEPRTNMALALLGVGAAPSAAIAHLTYALEVQPASAPARFAMIQALIASRQYDRAAAEYDRLLPLDPKLAAQVAPWLIAHW
jgi:Flp pilus assembly protein TadD